MFALNKEMRERAISFVCDTLGLTPEAAGALSDEELVAKLRADAESHFDKKEILLDNFECAHDIAESIEVVTEVDKRLIRIATPGEVLKILLNSLRAIEIISDYVRNLGAPDKAKEFATDVIHIPPGSYKNCDKERLLELLRERIELALDTKEIVEAMADVAETNYVVPRPHPTVQPWQQGPNFTKQHIPDTGHSRAEVEQVLADLLGPGVQFEVRRAFHGIPNGSGDWWSIFVEPEKAYLVKLGFPNVQAMKYELKLRES